MFHDKKIYKANIGNSTSRDLTYWQVVRLALINIYYHPLVDYFITNFRAWFLCITEVLYAYTLPSNLKILISLCTRSYEFHLHRL